MVTERRNEKRSDAGNASKGELFHIDSNQYLKVESIRDISDAGFGLNVDRFLSRGERVRLEFHYGIARMHAYGHVAWCDADISDSESDNDAAHFAMGISL